MKSKKILFAAIAAMSILMFFGCKNDEDNSFPVNVGNRISSYTTLYVQGTGDNSYTSCSYNYYVGRSVDPDQYFTDGGTSTRLVWYTSSSSSRWYLTSSKLSGAADIIVTDNNGHYIKYNYGAQCKSAGLEGAVIVEEGVANEMTPEEAAALGF